MPRRGGCHYWLLLFLLSLLLLGQLLVVVVVASSRSAATNPPPHDNHLDEEDVTSSWKRLYYESSSSSSSSDETERLLRTWTNNEEESSILRSMETTMASMEDHDERSDHDDGDEEEQVEEVDYWRSSLPAGTTGKPAGNYEADRLDGRTRGGGKRRSSHTNPERMRMSSSSTTTKTRRSDTPSTPRPHSNHHDGGTLSFAQILNMAIMSIREDDAIVPSRPAGFFLHPPPRTSRSKSHAVTTWSTTRTVRPHQPSFLLSRGVKLLEVRIASMNKALLLQDSTIKLVTTTEDPLRVEPHVVVLAQHTIRLVDSTRQQGTSTTTTTTRMSPMISLPLTSSANGAVPIAPTLPSSSLSATTTVTALPEDESTTSSGTTTTYWIRDFIKCHWQHGLFPVPRDFLVDNFNLANLPALLNITADEFRHAWKTLLQSRYVDNNDNDDDGNSSSDDESSSSQHHDEEDHHPQQQHNNITTIRLFLLLHQRFILSPRGLHLAHRQLLLLRRRQRRQNNNNSRHHHYHHTSDHGCFGRCPAISCRGSRTVPIGRSDLPGGAGGGTAVAHAYCPQCRHVWVNWDWQDDPVVDGCAWGTTFGHLLLLVYGTAAASSGGPPPQRDPPLDESSPSISLPSALSSSSSSSIIEQPYVPRIYGFRLHPSAAGLCG
jgi:casein kinase II subunit beta